MSKCKAACLKLSFYREAAVTRKMFTRQKKIKQIFLFNEENDRPQIRIKFKALNV